MTVNRAEDTLGFSSFVPLLEHMAASPLHVFHARDGISLSYRFYDSANKERVIILLHGSGWHGEYLHPFAQYLSSEGIGQVYVPNLRGHYGSGEVRGDCSYIGQLEDDLYDLIVHFELKEKQIFLAGHSSGGGLAIRIAGGPWGGLIRGFLLLSPAIPTAPTMRRGNAGGWADVYLLRLLCLSMINLLAIKCLNHLTVIRFNMPQSYCNGTETLSYSYNLNTSYHPSHYSSDINALKGRSLVIIGSEDQVNIPERFSEVMGDPEQTSIRILEGVGHLDLVLNESMMIPASQWIANTME